MDWDRVIYNGTVVNDDGMQRADIYIRDGCPVRDRHGVDR